MALRAIVEMVLLETMFEIPSKKDTKSVRVHKEVITKNKKPKIAYLTKKEKDELNKGSVDIIKIEKNKTATN